MIDHNLLTKLPAPGAPETFDDILRLPGLRIERIVSQGHTSPESGWYDQAEGEWVLVLQGAAELTFEDGHVQRLAAGDHVHLPPHCRHRVSWTDPQRPTVWLAVFYSV